MNILETFFAEQSPVVRTTDYKYGTYITLRHSTSDANEVIQDIQKIYLLSYQLIKGIKITSSDTYTTPRVPVPSRIEKSIETRQPLMVSSLQQKTSKTGTVLFSHHYLYGGHWSINHESDVEYLNDLLAAIPNYIGTVSKSPKNILIQPVGIREEQELDRPNDESFYGYITNYVNDKEEDTLLTQMVKQSPTGLKFALHYSYAK